MPQPEPEDIAQQLRLAYQTAFGGEGGELVLKDLEHEGHWNRPTLAPGDPWMTHFHEGRRDLLRHIKWMLNKEIEERQATVEEPTAD